MRKRIAGTGTALVLAITFGVMGATGIALAVGDTTTETTTTTTAAETKTVDGRSGNSPIVRIPMVAGIPE